MTYKNTVFFAGILAAVASIATAQPIVVRSGAHEGFARLVFRLPESSEWDVENLENGARVALTATTSGFDTSNVFQLIDRQYIEDVSSTQNTLEIAFACNCVASTFVSRGQFLVVDVADKLEMDTSGQLGVLGNFGWPTTSQRLAFSGVPNFSHEQADPETKALRSRNEFDVSSETKNAVVPDVVGNLTQLPAPEDQPDTDPGNQLAQAQQKLARRVAIAATQGVLDPSQAELDIPVGRARPQIDTEIFDSSVPNVTVNEQSSSLNLRVSSSSDLPTQGLSEQLQSTSLGVRCVDPELVAVETWGADVPSSDKLAEYRSELFSEFDRLNEEAAVGLTRLYLFYGFGAEARQVLSIQQSLAQQNPALLEIADIFEFGHVRTGNYLKNFADCDSNAALWGILAQKAVSPSEPINADAALLALTALPLHLRRFIAPMLSRRLLEYGDDARAETALRSIDRVPEPPSAQANLARAELQMAKGDTEVAQQTLADVVSSNEQQSAEALIQFVDSHLQEDSLIDENVATLVEAFAVEMRGSPLGVELKRTHVLALAKSGQYDQAFEALSRMRLIDDAETENNLRALLLELVTRSAPDVIFLERAIDESLRSTPIQDTRIMFSMAERSVDLGFSQLAETLLAQSPQASHSTRHKKLRARIALDLGRPHEAEAQLFGLDSDVADRLRARAKTMEKNYERAMEIFDQLDEPDESVRAALLAENWSRLSQSENSAYAPFAELIETPMEASEQIDGMLGRMSDAVAESQRARSVIRSLLDQSNTPIDATDP